MITHNQDGSYTMVGDADPTRKETIPAGLPTEEVIARQQAFTALEPEPPAPPTSEIEAKLSTLGLSLDDLRAALK